MQKAPKLSLNAVRVFECAARLGGMLAAAEELGVTPGAVSHQIRALEERIGVNLFRRRNNSIALTDAGRQFQRDVTPALATIERAANTLRHDRNEVVIRASVSLAVRWLIPALERFKTGAAEARIRLETTHYARVELGGQADIAISYLRRGEDGPGALLFKDVCRPMLSPALLDRCGYARRGDAGHVPALSATNGDWDWRLWATEAGIAFDSLTFSHGFDTDDAAIHAATAGLGMVLATPFMTVKEIAAGSLVHLPDAPAVATGELRLLSVERPSRLVRRLADWLCEEARRAA
ncbi:LysR family transcriptional regulator [Nitratireductor arenosus]|nr:LysR family transcriptional regulator [Nitratireductor arenosus]